MYNIYIVYMKVSIYIYLQVLKMREYLISFYHALTKYNSTGKLLYVKGKGYGLLEFYKVSN